MDLEAHDSFVALDAQGHFGPSVNHRIRDQLRHQERRDLGELLAAQGVQGLYQEVAGTPSAQRVGRQRGLELGGDDESSCRGVQTTG